MKSFTLKCKIEYDFGLEMDVVNNEILELSVVVKGTLCGFPIRYKSLIYEKPWESYLSPEELKEFMEMKL
ncbi:MAG: hypothetical protein M0R80_03920 [Proteobacteria bacterium]|jgi:hypothetical protein|nr:hypothetical protein [Pseudomonadota bacterium]